MCVSPQLQNMKLAAFVGPNYTVTLRRLYTV